MSRHRWLGLVLFSVILGSSGWLAAQPPRKEEEEEPVKEKARPVVPVPVEVPEKTADPAVVPAAGDDADVGSFKEEAARAGHPTARELFRGLSIPYDRLTANFQGGNVLYVELLPHRDLPESEFEVNRLDRALRNSTPQTLKTGSGFTFAPFELIVLEEIDKFLVRKTTMDRDEQLDYAARAAAAGLRWHRLAVTNNKRVGKAWDLVAHQLTSRHLALLRERFQLYLDAKKYDRADEVGLRMLARYPEKNEVLRDVYRLQLLRTDQGLKAPTDPELLRLRESLLLYERLPGQKDDALIAKARKRLKDRATVLVTEAKNLDAKKQTAAALGKLRTAEQIDPDAAAVAGVRAAIRGKVLYVGVRKLPELMSPALAETDAEKWAVELMFEGLLQAVPDPEVIRYRPALAEDLPDVMPLGRSFTLPKTARFARENSSPADARDVRGTLELLRSPALKDNWCSVGIDVFDEIDRISDPFRLRLAYRRGVLEPLSRATFKVLPAQYLRNEQKGADDEGFAREPFGTGPFRYEGREVEGANRECAVFRVNPHFGQRPGKFGLPWIREVRFYVPDQSRLAAEVAGGQLHIYPDVPSDLAPRFRTEDGLRDVMRIQPAATNRRVHVLAINHRKTVLQNDKLRQGLSAAVNREAILTDLFRVGDDRAHVALTGPFPIKAWATPPTARAAPLYKPGAGGLIAEGLNGRGGTRLRLVYKNEDPKLVADAQKAGQVAQKIKEQIEQASADKGGKPIIEVDLAGLPAREFREKVHLEHDYDLALTTFDYRDDLYSLAWLLDPDAGGRGGRNYLGYLAPGTNPTDADRRLRKLIDEVRQFRDFTKQVKDRTWDIHALFNQRVPFVPLWQLDRYMVVHRDVEIHFDSPDATQRPDQLDPAVVFTGVEMWQVK